MSVARQPETGTAPAGSCDAAKHARSSRSGGEPASWPPASTHRPVVVSTLLQYSKWPVSSEKSTLYEWAAQGTRVCSLDVEYIGWKAYGAAEQEVALGSKFTCWKPLAMLAVMEPTWCVVRSESTTLKPAAVSNRSTRIRSPDRMNRSVPWFGVKVSSVADSGPAGAWAVPFFVMNAKLTGSTPTWLRQDALFTIPLFWSWDRLSMFSAAHHWVTSQLRPSGQGIHPG